MKEARYLTDDRDLPAEDLRELVVFHAPNGDWYVAVTEPGAVAWHAVRICTSGGASTAAPGLPLAVSDAFHAIRGSS